MLSLVIMGGAGERDDFIFLAVHAHNEHALAGPRAFADGVRLDADNHPVRRDQNHVVRQVDNFNRRDVAVLFHMVVQ